MEIDTFAKIAPRLYRSGTATELVGGPGIGKSSVMATVAAQMSIETRQPFGMVTHMLSQMDPIDLRGFVFPTKEDINGKQAAVAKTTRPAVFPTASSVDVYVDGELKADYDGLPNRGMVFLDEYGQCGLDMQKASAQFILERRLGDFQLPAGWVVWAASNRMSDKAGVVKRLSLTQNRMKQIEIVPSFAAWSAWANKAGVHPLSITFARRFPSKVFREAVPTEPGPFATPRSLVLCTQDLMALRDESHGDTRLPDDGVAIEVVSAWLGEGVAIDFTNHIRLANDLPEIDQVARAPSKTKVPERTDARFIMANMLAHHIDDKNAEPFLHYMERMDVEMQVLFVDSATRRNPLVIANSSFNEWISKNNQLLLAANQA